MFFCGDLSAAGGARHGARQLFRANRDFRAIDRGPLVACARHTARARAIQIEHALRFHLLFVAAMIASAVAALSASATAQTSSPQYSASLGSAGVEAMWQVPSGAPHSILFLAHGCNHQGTDFWHASAVCNKCLGLPEEVRIVKAALAANFAVIAVTSIDRDSGCWTFEADAPRVRDAIAAFRTAAGLPGSLPIVALGASSGGAFALQLPAVVPCMAVVSQIMAIPPNMLPATMPPTLFVHMPRDQRTASYVHKDVRKLRQAGVAAHELQVHAQRPSKEFFLERIERLTPAAAASLHAALDKAGLLDKHGFLRDDPRRSDWRGAIRSSAGLAQQLLGDSLVGDASAISEALNVAWAMHEIVSDPMEATIRWLADVRAGKPEREPQNVSSPQRMVEPSNELRR